MGFAVERAPREVDERTDGRAALREAHAAFGTDALSFLAFESGMRIWAAPGEPSACVAYVDSGSAWVAVASPLAREEAKSQVAERFVAAAKERRRRASFFAATFEGDSFTRLLIGERPMFQPAEWLRQSSRHARFREQLRRARAKSTRVRAVDPAELAEGSPLRLAVDRLAGEWLASRRIEPMAFLVAFEPYHEPERHRYFVAERDGRLVGFLSAVPFRQGRAWLVEDAPRSRTAPNGTTELMIDALMRAVADADWVTLGLCPLSGAVAWPLRAARRLARPLFDFSGLRRFRQRMRPQLWEPVYLVIPRHESVIAHVIGVLRAFAGGSLLRFAARSLALRPSGLPWAFAVSLVPWTVAIACMAAVGATESLGFSRIALALFAAFDGCVAFLLFRAAMAPTAARLVGCAAFASCDALLSAAHLATVGVGRSAGSALLRIVATIAPALASVTLAVTAFAENERRSSA
jgi:lysylphosphatidylglycerol synthetase-like protein (DUF2156 family)